MGVLMKPIAILIVLAAIAGAFICVGCCAGSLWSKARNAFRNRRLRNAPQASVCAACRHCIKKRRRPVFWLCKATEEIVRHVEPLTGKKIEHVNYQCCQDANPHANCTDFAWIHGVLPKTNDNVVSIEEYLGSNASIGEDDTLNQEQAEIEVESC